MAAIRLVETSLRDGNQCLWGALGVATARTLAIAPQNLPPMISPAESGVVSKLVSVSRSRSLPTEQCAIIVVGANGSDSVSMKSLSPP